MIATLKSSSSFSTGISKPYTSSVWIARAKALNIPELTEALKPFENWTEEISNYHKCRYTNGAVEGRNNKIKTLIRRSYFLPNRMIYENRIFLECNERFFIDELSVKNQFWC